MAKAGKVHHWKHGWIPLDAFARRLVGKAPSSPHVDADEARRARYAAHLKATAEKRAATQARYQAHLKATAKQRQETEARYLAAQNRKR